jgi:hypothetical protein
MYVVVGKPEGNLPLGILTIGQVDGSESDRMR